jgi:hypothetical protein
MFSQFTIQDIEVRVYTHLDGTFSARLKGRSLFIGNATPHTDTLSEALALLASELDAYNARRVARRAIDVD